MPEDGPHHPIARRVRTAREYGGLSRAGLAEALGLSAGQVGRYERGEWQAGGTPKPPVLREIARVTGVPEWFMFGGWEAAQYDVHGPGMFAQVKTAVSPQPTEPEQMADEALAELDRASRQPLPESTPATPRSPRRRSA